MDNHTHQTWVINLTGIDKGIFRTMNGNADELIAIGRVIKQDFLAVEWMLQTLSMMPSWI